MNTIWFKRFGWTYVPVHLMGFVVTALGLVFLLQVGIAVTSKGHSATDDLYTLFVYASCTAFWWKWIAEKTTENRR